MKKNILLCCLLLCIASLHGQQWNPAISLTPLVATPLYRLDAADGVYAFSGSRFSAAFEFSNTFTLGSQAFLRTGIRYLPLQTTVAGLNQIEAMHDKPDPLIWTRRYGAVTVPVHLGRKYQTQKGRTCSLHAGVSAGLFLTTMAMNEVNKNVNVNVNNNDTVFLQLLDSPNLAGPQFFATVDVGANWQPFPKAKRFLLGPMVSLQVNRVKAGSYQGLAQNLSQNLTYEYRATVWQRFVCIGITASYHLRKPAERTPGRPLPSNPQ